MSKTTTESSILQIVASLANAQNIHPYALMVPCAVAANCAFMLPVGTPPNAIIFGTGKITILEMVKNGFWLNLIARFLFIAAVYFYLPVVWDINLHEIPSKFL